jgi:AcrR family transcriptional regulator
VATTPRERILEAAMRLFGELGFAGTTISRIEQAAGLSPGSGALYRHFASKEDILAAGVERAMASSTDLAALLADPTALDGLSLEQRLLQVARAGLRRLEDERDLNRLILRDLGRFPELLARVGRDEVARTARVVADWLRTQSGPEGGDGADWDAVAMVLVGGVTHYWILRDTFGAHPAGLSEERVLAAAAALGAAALRGNVPPVDGRGSEEP